MKDIISRNVCIIRYVSYCMYHTCINLSYIYVCIQKWTPFKPSWCESIPGTSNCLKINQIVFWALDTRHSLALSNEVTRTLSTETLGSLKLESGKGLINVARYIILCRKNCTARVNYIQNHPLLISTIGPLNPAIHWKLEWPL